MLPGERERLPSRVWVLGIAASALLLLLLSLLLLRGRGAAVVQVVLDGEVLREIDLSRVAQPYQFEVAAPEGGHNTILVEPGRVCVSAADCPDGLCVQQGWLSDGGLPLVCLPHRLMVRAVEPGEIDAVAVTR